MPRQLTGTYQFTVPVGTDIPDVIKDMTTLAKQIDPAVKTIADAPGGTAVALAFRGDQSPVNWSPIDATSVRLFKYGKLVFGQMRIRNLVAWTIAAGGSNVPNMTFANIVRPSEYSVGIATFPLSCEVGGIPIIASAGVIDDYFYIEHVHSRTGDSAVTVPANAQWNAAVAYATA